MFKTSFNCANIIFDYKSKMVIFYIFNIKKSFGIMNNNKNYQKKGQNRWKVLQYCLKNILRGDYLINFYF